MARYHGKDAVVYLSTSGSGTAAALTQTGWTLDRTTDKAEVSSCGDANKIFVQGLPNLQGTISSFWDDTDAKLFTASQSADGCKIYLYPSRNAASKYFYGTAWLDASMTLGVNGAVAVNANFVAASSWGLNM